jgi:molybdate transport system substrate-binding protein
VRARVVTALVIGAVLCGSCGTTGPAGSSASGPSGAITVFAASSLRSAYTAIGNDFQKSHPGTMVTFAFAGSSVLAAQIREGAIADVFASADQPTMQTLVDGRLTAGSPSVFSRNALEIVVRPGNPKHIRSLSDLSHTELVVVLCAPVVPCGRYAAEAVHKAGVTLTPASQETAVTAVISKVAFGEADAGIVYRTDVKAAGSRVQGVEIPPALNVVAEYPIAVLKDSQDVPLANAFIDYVLADGQQTLGRYGFTGP